MGICLPPLGVVDPAMPAEFPANGIWLFPTMVAVDVDDVDDEDDLLFSCPQKLQKKTKSNEFQNEPSIDFRHFWHFYKWEKEEQDDDDYEKEKNHLPHVSYYHQRSIDLDLIYQYRIQYF